MANRPNTNCENYPHVLHIQNAASLTLSSISYDGADLMCFKEDGTCVTERSSRPSSSTSFSEEDSWGEKISNNKPQLPFRGMYQETSAPRIKSIYVQVSGTSFVVPRDAFVKLGKLKWDRDHTGVAHLNTSPAIFEVLIGYIIFGTLPAYDTLSKTEYDQFEPMAMKLGLYELVEHFDRSSDKRHRRRSLFQKKKLSSLNSREGTHIVLNRENTNMASTRLLAANSSCARFLASFRRKSAGKRRDCCSKFTHDQICTLSDHVT